MFTFRLNNTTEQIYNEILTLHNSCFNTKFSIKNIIPYATQHFIEHGNEKYIKHYNLVGNYKNQEFILDKGLYNGIRRMIKNSITLQDILNHALNLYIIPLKADFIRDIIGYDRMLLILNHFNYLKDGFKVKQNSKPDSEYDTEFIITACPICGHDSFYINPDNLEVGCFREGNCLIHNFEINDIISVISYTEKLKYPEIINILFDLIVKNWNDNSSVLNTLEPGFIKCSKLKNKITNRINEIQNIIVSISDENLIKDYQKEMASLKDNLEKLYAQELEEEKKIATRNNILFSNGVREYDYLISKGFSKDVLEDLDIFYINDNITKDHQTNSFRYRLCYPVYSDEGVLVGVQGRSIFDSNEERRNFLMKDILFSEYYECARKNNFNKMYDNTVYELTNEEKIKVKVWNNINNKILNSSGFHKSEHLYLLNKFTHKTNEIIRVIVVEGLKDAIMLYSYILNRTAVVSTMGSSISKEQVDLLKRYFPNAEIILAFDNDISGVDGNITAYGMLRNAGFTRISFVVYPNEVKDFGSLEINDATRNSIVSILKDRVDLIGYSLYIKNSKHLSNDKTLKNISNLCR